MRYGFLFIALSIILSILGYVICRGWQALPSQGLWRQLYAGLSILLFLLFLAALLFGQKMAVSVASVVSFAGNTYFVVLIYLLLSFLLVDAVRLVNAFVHFAPAGMFNFRYWWMLGSLVVIAIALVVGNYQFNHPETVMFNLQTDKPRQHKELKIVAVSDIHLGFSIDKKKLQEYVKMINSQHPDIVLIAGDVSDRSVEPIIRQNMKEDLLQIKAPLGVFAINGNHEFYAEQPGATAEYLRQSGIHVLIDSVSMIDKAFYIIGRDDRTNEHRKSLAALVNGLNPTLPKIVLDHQPLHLEEAEQNGIDLQISGHTHNGQFFPGNLLVKSMYELAHGYLKKGHTHYYVSSGLGIWGPQYRIGSQSEIVVIKLRY
jgi:hypothetical protein